VRLRQAVIGMTAIGLMAGVLAPAALAGSGRTPFRQMTCADFLLSDDAAKPEIVYWVATRDRGGRPNRAVVDVDATDNLVPVLVDQCKGAPNDPFWPKVRVAFETASEFGGTFAVPAVSELRGATSSVPR
jgi:HdeA/HdeB family protein